MNEYTDLASIENELNVVENKRNDFEARIIELDRLMDESTLHIYYFLHFVELLTLRLLFIKQA